MCFDKNIFASKSIVKVKVKTMECVIPQMLCLLVLSNRLSYDCGSGAEFELFKLSRFRKTMPNE